MRKRLAIGNNAFTLVELLVVISIIALLVAIVLPAINNALFRGRLTASAANGRSIHNAIFAKETEGVYSTTRSAWPKSDEFQDSSDYFNNLVTNRVLNVGYNFFAAPGIATAPSEEDFKSDNHNAWCVVEDITESTSETLPVIFTRNLGDTSMKEFSDNIYTETSEGISTELRDVSPFGTKGFVFVTKGGAAFALFKDDLTCGSKNEPGPFRNLFNFLDLDGQPVDNTILRPVKEDT